MEMIDDEDNKDSSHYLVFKCISHVFSSYFQSLLIIIPKSFFTKWSKNTGANPGSSDLRLVSPLPLPGNDDYGDYDDYHDDDDGDADDDDDDDDGDDEDDDDIRSYGVGKNK